MFVIILKYVHGLEKVEENLEAHREYLDKYYSFGNFIVSGAQNPRVGGIIICKAESRELVDRIISEDPFCINNAVEYEVIEFAATKYASVMKNIIL